MGTALVPARRMARLKTEYPGNASGRSLPEATMAEQTGYKIGENGVEGKCAICGQYVIKGGVKFREKSVLCSDDAERLAKMGNPYHATPGRR